MASNSSSYGLLLQKLDKFIRKYYTNQLMRGAIFSGVYVLAFFLFITLLEYYLYLSPALRKVLFFGFIASSVAFVARYVALPLLHYYRLGKIITYEQAAEIVGTHFTEVKDKLLNILQLNQVAGVGGSELLLAAIDQKALELKPIDFSFAIDLNKNRKYLRFLAPPLLLFLFIVIAAPNVIKEGTRRLYHNDTFYEKQAPFQFAIQNKELKALQFGNYLLEVKIEGEALPSEVYMQLNNTTVRLKKKEKDLFTHQFENLQKTTPFRFTANGYKSKEYVLQVVAKPMVTNFEIACNYPAYTGKADETVNNVGDLVVPAGTKLSWRFTTQNAEWVTLTLADSAYRIQRRGDNEFVFAKTFYESLPYSVQVSNGNVKNADSAAYSLNVVPDLYPVIAVNEKKDSAARRYFYYVGDVSDDYGVRRVTFNYTLTRTDSAGATEIKSIEVPVAGGIAARFTYYWSLTDFNIQPGDKMSYYFEVWDNDGVRGSKSTRSGTMAFEMPTLNELNKEIARENKDLKDELKATMKDAQEMKKDLQDMRDKLMEKQNLNWEDKKNLQDNIEKQKELQEQLREMKDKLAQNFEKQNEFKDIPESVKEKQKNLQELMEKVLDEEMKKLMEKLEKMLEELQKKDALDKMADMEMNNEKLEKELDRMLELFKKLEFDQKLQETSEKLEKLAEQQEELAKKQEQNPDGKEAKNEQQLKEEQKKLEEGLKEAKQDLQDLKKLNEETKSEQGFKEVEKSLETAEKQMDDAQQNQNQKQNSKASQNQKSASNNMKDAAQKLSDMKMEMEQEQTAEDMQAIRQLLENIVQLSFDEEKLMNSVKQTNINNPKYVDLMKEQQRVRENSKMVEDSLYALAKRQEQIKSFITKEITTVNRYLARAIDDMEERNIIKAVANQQFVMTGYNNLALMLSEALQQMQQQMSESQQQQQSGMKMCQKCKKPGNGLPNLSKMQKQLNDKISQVAEMMKKQGQGEKPGSPSQGMSKQFAEMAQMQQQIRKELERIGKEEGKDGKGQLGNLGEAVKQMEETEKNLVNKQLTTEMLKRQNEIMTKLLEAENAQRQREEQPERESKAGQEKERKMPPALEEYLKARNSETDLYKTVPPALKPYYKSLAEKYFRSIAVAP